MAAKINSLKSIQNSAVENTLRLGVLSLTECLVHCVKVLSVDWSVFVRVFQGFSETSFESRRRV